MRSISGRRAFRRAVWTARGRARPPVAGGRRLPTYCYRRPRRAGRRSLGENLLERAQHVEIPFIGETSCRLLAAEPLDLVHFVLSCCFFGDRPHRPVADGLVRSLESVYVVLVSSGPSSTARPASSSTSRRAACSSVSSSFTLPFGKVQSPYFGRCTSSTSRSSPFRRYGTPPAARTSRLRPRPRASPESPSRPSPWSLDHKS